MMETIYSANWKKLLSGMVFLLLMCCSIILGGKAHAANTTYYVDPAGNDANSGTSTTAAWRTLAKVNATTFSAGDRILFKSGGSWTGQLHPLGSGSSGAPIVIDKYGSGNNPLIDGNGASSTVYLYNQSYWEINNLEVKNYNGFNSKRRGIFIVNDGAGTLNHVYVKNNNVHDVWGDNTKDVDGSAGIMYVSKGTVPSKFNDVLIDGNTVGPDVDRTGIVIVSEFWCRVDVNCTSSPNWYPSTNVVISNNYVQGVGGDGIVPQQTDGAIVQYNTVNGFNMRSGSYNAGIWPWDADNTVIQYNEAYNGHTTLDGTGFDADFGCTNTIIQYNYSHDNDGGFLLLMGTDVGTVDQTTVRYNISQNDRRGILVFSQGNPTGLQVYNNDFFIGSSGLGTDVITADHGNHAWWMYNNIIYNWGLGGYNLRGIVSDYNLYYGNHPSSEPNEAHKLTSDPAFVNPGSGGLGLASLDGYKLLQDSPAIGSGAFVDNNGGKDFWGNVVASSGSPNRGAYNGAGIASGFNSGYYKIISRNSDKALTVPGNSTTGGTQLQQLTYTGGDNQLWQLVYVGGGYYKIISKLSGLAVNISGSSTANGAQIIQWASGSGDNEKWKPEGVGGGYYQIYSKISGKAIDVSGGSTLDDAPIIQWPYDGGYNQQWQIVQAP